jgi:hypothetical protein
MKRSIFRAYAALLFVALLASCVGDLDTEPLNTRVSTAPLVFKNPESYKEFLAKLYGAMTLTGQRGEYGQPELSAPDEGTTSFMRMYWSAQEITTDECVSAWGDASLIEYHAHNWSEQNFYVQLLYQRVFINIAYCNEYIRAASQRVDGLDAGLRDDVKQYIAEAKFLRALYYYFALDLWGNVPFVTEADAPGAYLPRQIKRADLFQYIDQELTAILPTLAPPGENEYARADRAAAWMLLARLHLNAGVYLEDAGTEHYTQAINYCNEIIQSNAFSLIEDYSALFLADNDQRSAEIIFPIAEDGDNGRNYGGVTFIIHAASGGNLDLVNDIGIAASGGWAGSRYTSTFVHKFADPSGATDHRALFFTDGQTLDITNVTNFREGYLSRKFRNVTSTGVRGKNDTFVDTDFPLFRLADVYLMYAEAVLRGGTGGDRATALQYINLLRHRAYGNDSGNIADGDLTLPFILDERGRELHWEAQRRTDLIRFGVFTGDDYLWDWKGNVKAGAATPGHFTLFPIPLVDRAINTNLQQNPEY